jgi:hypothetical protein
VTVVINKANSGANAKISAGLIGLNGLATLTPADSTKTVADQLVLHGTTDAFGNVAFVISNTDTAGELPPATKTSAVPTTGAVFGNFIATLDGVSGVSKTLEEHFYKAAPPAVTSITAVAVGKKITVTIKNAVGKSSTITITGKAKVTLTPTSATQVLNYTVTKGVKKVVVVSNGKTLTKTFTIK